MSASLPDWTPQGRELERGILDDIAAGRPDAAHRLGHDDHGLLGRRPPARQPPDLPLPARLRHARLRLARRDRRAGGAAGHDARRGRRRRHPLRAGPSSPAPRQHGLAAQAPDRRRRWLRHPARIPARRLRRRTRSTSCSPTSRPSREAFGVPVKATEPPELGEALDWAFATEGPAESSRRARPTGRRHDRLERGPPPPAARPRPLRARPEPGRPEAQGSAIVGEAELERGPLRAAPRRARRRWRGAAQAWSYPEHAYLELREASRWRPARAPTRSSRPRHPDAHPHPLLGLPHDGDRVVVPQPDIRPLRAGLAGLRATRGARAVAGAEARPRADRRRRPTHRRPPGLDLRPEQPDPVRPSAKRSGAPSWTRCRPAAWWRPTRRTPTTSSRAGASGARTTWPPAARWWCCARSRRSSASPGCGSGYALAAGLGALPAGRAGALQREPPGARGGRGEPRPPGGDVDERRRATAAARDHLASGPRAAGLEPLPSEANFLLVEHGADDDALADRLLRRGVLVRPGAKSACPAGRGSRWARGCSWTVSSRRCAVLKELSPARARAR